MQAPDFSLPDQNGKIHKLSDYLGKWLILYFYPKDDTPGCTKEACSFRDNINSFKQNNIEIVGVSKDSISSHLKFAQKYNLNFTLLSDESKEIIEKYNAWGEKKFLGKTFEGVLRKTFLINPDGKIIKEYQKVNPLTHSKNILDDFSMMQK